MEVARYRMFIEYVDGSIVWRDGFMHLLLGLYACDDDKIVKKMVFNIIPEKENVI